MGTNSSKYSSEEQVSDHYYRSANNSSWDNYGYPQSPLPQQSPYYTPQHHHAPPSSSSFGYKSPKRNLDRKYSRISDDYHSLDEVTSALKQAGLESSNLIVGIDFTKSNDWTGSRSFNHKSLHHIGKELNPYEQAISIIGKTLSAFDEDNLIPCYGFGDASTYDKDVFNFFPNNRNCNGFEEVLTRYRELVPHLRLAGPTSFAPVIEMAMTIVEQSRGQYHVLVIIADGQVTRSVNTRKGQLSSQEYKTIDAIVRASQYPLSIIVVGVGDGPWDMMRAFDDNIPTRAFDNFQFVNFTEIMSKNTSPMKKQTEFALSALMEIPSQYKATIELGILGRQLRSAPNRRPLRPPITANIPSRRSIQLHSSSSFQNNATSYSAYETELTRPPSQSSTYVDRDCPICLTNPKNLAFGCGHQTCFDCGELLQTCPICRSSIQTRIRLY